MMTYQQLWLPSLILILFCKTALGSSTWQPVYKITLGKGETLASTEPSNKWSPIFNVKTPTDSGTTWAPLFTNLPPCTGLSPPECKKLHVEFYAKLIEKRLTTKRFSWCQWLWNRVKG